MGTETRQWTDMINNPRRPIANWHHLRPIPGIGASNKYQHLHQSINCLVVEKNRFEKIFPKRANLTKAISVDANEAKEAILSLKRTKSTQDECYSPLD